MASSSASALSPAISSSPLRLRSHHHHRHRHRHHLLAIVTAPSRVRSPLRASRKSPNYPQDAVVVVPDPRTWVRDFGEFEGGNDEDDEDDEEEDEDDRSLDLLARFIENIFRKISRRARKAVRSVLPPSISTKLVGFSVNGVLILAFLWVLKALLEVVCTLGSMVFVSILLVRGIWSGIAYMKEHRYHNHANRMDDDNSVWTGIQPAT